jgi:hypothetical protein
MYKLEYYNGKTHLETFYNLLVGCVKVTNIPIVKWKIKQLKAKGYVGTFKYKKTNII